LEGNSYLQKKDIWCLGIIAPGYPTEIMSEIFRALKKAGWVKEIKKNIDINKQKQTNKPTNKHK